ncbi:MAG: hypothetical protein FWF99_01520 [Desulfovibrionaceae bacterium]|nr:hypothetical protein [Desulfovibrionaceae bacterium]
MLYHFLAGPMLILSITVFFGGMIYRLVSYFRGLDWRLERVAYTARLPQGMKGGLHSICKWLIPFGTRGWRAQPFFTVCFLLLHTGAVLTPAFLAGHNVILQDTLGFTRPSMPQPLADVLVLGTIAGAALILLRRLVLAEVRILTTASDYGILVLAVLPFVTGFVTRLHTDLYNFWLLCHIISGELLLILAPFTRLSHMVLHFASRWQLGADYAIKRGGSARGPCFPW